MFESVGIVTASDEAAMKVYDSCVCVLTILPRDRLGDLEAIQRWAKSETFSIALGNENLVIFQGISWVVTWRKGTETKLCCIDIAFPVFSRAPNILAPLSEDILKDVFLCPHGGGEPVAAPLFEERYGKKFRAARLGITI